MTTLVLDDELDAALEAISAEQGRAKNALATDILRKYVEAGRLKRAMQDPALIALYQQLAEEDVMLAEQGMGDYHAHLTEADHA